MDKKRLPEPWPLDVNGFPIVPKDHWGQSEIEHQERNVKEMTDTFYASRVREEFKDGTPAWMLLYFYCGNCKWFKVHIASSEGEICSECGVGHQHDKPGRAVWTGVHPYLIAWSRAWVDCHKVWDALPKIMHKGGLQ